MLILIDTHLGLECKRKIFNTIIVERRKRRIKCLKKNFERQKIKKSLSPVG
jgi:hypothetical protein